MAETMPVALRRIVYEAIAKSMQAKLDLLDGAKPTRANQVRTALLNDLLEEVQIYHPDSVQ